MAIVALVVWTFTVAAGVYMLITSTRVVPPGQEARPGQPAAAGGGDPAPVGALAAEARVAPGGPGPQPAPGPASVLGLRAVQPGPRELFDPPSLARAKAEPIPGLRALAEFIHPLLGILGFGMFIGYVLTRTWILGAIALGIVVGAIVAGVSWAIANARGARRENPDRYAMTFTPRLMLLHGAGALVALLLATLIVARV
ncbi:MAG TPA: hypothetical protein VH478_10260 [Trebonia sp.]|jgi:hypothetical protein|nr:hypothetical protein [Trebonia sp.]